MSEKELLQSIRNDPRGWLAEVDRLRARIAELEQAVESQVSEIADKGESISILRERVRIRNERIAELEAAASEDHDWDEFRTYTDTGVLAEKTCSRCRISRQINCKDDREAAQRPPLGYVVGFNNSHGLTFARDYGGPYLTRAGAEQELAHEAEENPGVEFRLIALREVQP